MADVRNDATVTVTMTQADRNLLKDIAKHLGLSSATYARFLIKRELNASAQAA